MHKVYNCDFINNEIQANHISPAYIPYDSQPAYLSTKVFGHSQFHLKKKKKRN